MSRLNEYKKATFEDKFWRNWVCCKVNHNEVWSWIKRANRRKYRRFVKNILKNELNEV